jgi:hypothetical protein
LKRIDSRSLRPWLRAATGVIAAMVIALVLASAALADSASLTVTNNNGQTDPVGDVPRVFTVSGTSAVSEHLYVKYRAPGGAACAPSADTDSGNELSSFYDEPVNGDFSFQDALTFSPGTYMFCIWLSDWSNTVTSPISQTVTFRRPTGTITASLDPVVLAPGQQGTVTITGNSEAPKYVYATVRPAGAQCAPTYGADTGSSLIWGEGVNGQFSLQQTLTEDDAGSYVICLWLADSENDPSPVAGPQAQPFTVGSPTLSAPPPRLSCKVPNFNKKTSLGQIVRKLSRANCAIGTVGRRHSKNVKRGYVLQLTPGPRAVLSNGAPVNIVVSAGKKRRRHR